jgi:hypothetical protein
MKFLVHCAIAFVACTAMVGAKAGDVSLKSDEEMCESEIPDDRAAAVDASRAGNIITLDVMSELNCAHVPAVPELSVWRNTATVSLPTTSSSDAAALCLCAHRLSFEIRGLYEGVQTIYYVQDGRILGHVDAP